MFDCPKRENSKIFELHQTQPCAAFGVADGGLEDAKWVLNPILHPQISLF
ncbi:MAG: hypothetical protein ACI9LN_002128 [Saprospiraceae bacterium]|jgi:hypothetical protein